MNNAINQVAVTLRTGGSLHRVTGGGGFKLRDHNKADIAKVKAKTIATMLAHELIEKKPTGWGEAVQLTRQGTLYADRLRSSK